MEKEKQLTFIDENGNEVLCEILFTFNSEEFGKNYVIFYPTGSDSDEEEQVEVMAAAYVEGEDGQGELQAIETDEEWEMIENVLKEFDENEGCDCEDCDCEDCDCEDCDENEEECHCCCCHSEEK